MLTPGHFIVVEGLEGAGKSTAMNTIQTFLSSRVGDYLVTREPGGTTVGETVRELIKHAPHHEALDFRAELLLLYASRIQLVERVIKPALQRGQWVLADRFELSTYAYQGGGRGIPTSIIDYLSHFCLNTFKPDLILFLDVDPEVGLTRALHRSSADRIEKESIDFFMRVYDAYHAYLKTLQNVMIIDANQHQKAVQKAILNALENYWSAIR